MSHKKDAVACRNNDIAGFSPGQIETLLQVESDNTESATERSKSTHQTNTFSSYRPAPRPTARQPLYQLADRPFHSVDHIEIREPSDRSSDLHTSRRPFSSLDRMTRISRKEICPQSLEESSIQWDWDPYDDYYIWIALVSESQMQRLRERTRRIFNGDSTSKIRSNHPLSGPAYTYTPGRRYVDDLNIDGYDHRRQYRESFREIEHPERRRSRSRTRTTYPRRQRSQYDQEMEVGPYIKRTDADRGHKVQTMQTSQDEVRIPRRPEAEIAIEVVEKTYREQVEKQKSTDSNCRVLDLEFEAMVQNLFWDAGIPLETCDTLIKMHEDKEAIIIARSHDDGAHHNYNADHCNNCNGSTKAASEGRREEDDKKREGLTCSMKVEIDGVITPCAETFREDDALRRHEENHLPRAPYYMKESREVKRPPQRQDSPGTEYTTTMKKKRFVRNEDPDTRSMQRVREYS